MFKGTVISKLMSIIFKSILLLACHRKFLLNVAVQCNLGLCCPNLKIVANLRTTLY